MKIRSFVAAIAAFPLAASMLAIAPPPEAPCYVLDARDPATADDDVKACRAQGYIHGNETRIGNVAATGHDDFPSWDATAPTTSYQAGGGAMYVGASIMDQAPSPMDPSMAATYEGEFTGQLDSVAVTQYLISPVDHYVYGDYYFRVRVEVDGENVYESDFIEGDVTTFEETGDGIGRFQVAVTGLYNALPHLRSDGEHDIRITINPFVPGDEAIFVYDAVEVPSNVIFNAPSSELGAFLQVSAA